MNRERDKFLGLHQLNENHLALDTICYMFATCLQAQPPTFNHLTVENGLSHNAVLAITQDHRGFMWFGTQIGLNRYDGHQFKIYKLNRNDSCSISDNNILSLLPDSRNLLWIGTSNGLESI